jgi:hypothetical protein
MQWLMIHPNLPNDVLKQYSIHSYLISVKNERATMLMIATALMETNWRAAPQHHWLAGSRDSVYCIVLAWTPECRLGSSKELRRGAETSEYFVCGTTYLLELRHEPCIATAALRRI